MTLTALGYAFLGGLLPSFIWLYFLLKEDARCPEPRTIVALAFIAGMAAVPLALPLEQYAKANLFDTVPVLTAWALIEEMLKYIMAATFILWRHAVDEAPDYVIYMITVALGFAAAENMLFLLTPLSNGHIATSFFTGDIRFLGSTLLHIIASATIGFAFAFSKDLGKPARVTAAACGLILAIALHTAFNTLIISAGTSTTFTAFFLVWTAAVVFFATFEVLKYFQYRNLPTNTCLP
ncbi:MAG: PrsW family glutamic-type intramembrane protease [Candidatus Kaiserbacteria bacterium]|nr:PrsW family glutamic-type intramembrane protease [Candidatus Kaiserbacteria bacterium]